MDIFHQMTVISTCNSQKTYMILGHYHIMPESGAPERQTRYIVYLKQ